MISKTCAVSGKQFIVTDEDMVFYEKMGVPAPALCPEERKRRRLAWQNMNSLHNRTCDATGKSIISVYSPEAKFPVYDQAYWWSDAWEPESYGRDFEEQESFFEQWKSLMNAIPHAALITGFNLNQNSDFVNYASFVKNCYLSFHTTFSEDCMFCVGLKNCRDVLNSVHVYDSELCYECLDCENCFELRYGQNCQSCSDSWFLKNCIGCSDCFGCVNLRNKRYYFLNQKCTKEEYETKIAVLNLSSRSQLENLRDEFLNKFVKKYPHRSYEGNQNEDVSGNWIYQSKNIHESYSVRGGRDCKYCERIYNNCENCYDLEQFGHNAELVYECECSGVDIYNLIGCIKVREGSSDAAYNAFCLGIQHCFGCIGLRKRNHCILNKSYTKHEYDTLSQKIISHMKEAGEWGEFFPAQQSPFAYNETIAQEYFPLTKEEALTKGYRWKESTEQPSDQTADRTSIPDNITDIDDSILEQTLVCDVTGKPYRLVKPELQFYRKMKLPIPVLHPDERYRQRMALRNPRKLWDRKCDNCPQNMKTSYAPDRPEKVLCESCYQEVVQ